MLSPSSRPPRSLAEMLRSHRRAYLAIVVGGLVHLLGQAAAGWFVRGRPETSPSTRYLFGLGWIVKLRSFSGWVRPSLVADLICHYVEHPAQRQVIGTPEEYARLQVTARLESITA